MTSTPKAGSSLSGTVNDARGVPEAGALVTLSIKHDGAYVTVSDASGEFSFDRQIEGDAGLTATTPDGRAAFVKIESSARRVDLELTGGGGLLFEGVVRRSSGKPVAGARVRVVEWRSWQLGNYHVVSGRDGRFRLKVPEGTYSIRVQTPRFVSSEYRGSADNRRVEIEVFERPEVTAPANASLVRWLRSNHRRKSLAALVSGAQVVGLGEATHGTSEFYRSKSEVIQELVTEHGFRNVAVEANWAEARRVNEYIQSGAGDLEAAISGLHFWTIDTAEFTALVERLRDINEQRDPRDRVHLFGIDVQYAKQGVVQLIDYFERFQPELAKELARDLRVLAGERSEATRAVREEADTARQLVAALEAARRVAQDLVSDGKEAWEHELAVQQIDVLLQTVELWRQTALHRDADSRDLSMAKNVRWILNKRGRTALWAHNAHIARSYTFGLNPAGSHLSRWFGDEYVSVAYLFGQGSFRARDGTDANSLKRGVVSIEVELPGARFAEHAFASTGLPRLVLDLREVLSAPDHVRSWFEVPRCIREVGAVYEGDDDMECRRLDRLYDVVVFFARTKAAKPNPTGVRGPGE